MSEDTIQEDDWEEYLKGKDFNDFLDGVTKVKVAAEAFFDGRPVDEKRLGRATVELRREEFANTYQKALDDPTMTKGKFKGHLKEREDNFVKAEVLPERPIWVQRIVAQNIVMEKMVWAIREYA